MHAPKVSPLPDLYYFWHYTDDRTGKRRKTSWRMTKFETLRRRKVLSFKAGDRGRLHGADRHRSRHRVGREAARCARRTEAADGQIGLGRRRAANVARKFESNRRRLVLTFELPAVGV